MSTQAVHDRFLDREGARLRWRIEGSGPALVLLHGWALDLEYFDAAISLLAPRFTLLRFDRRGFGLSSGRPDPSTDVDDLDALMAHAGISRAVVLGMSQGARLALRFASLHRPRVRALILDGAPALDSEPELPMAELRRVLAGEGLAALRARIRAHPLMQPRHASEGLRQRLDTILQRYPGEDLLHPPPRLAETDLSGLDLPALILHGEGDTRERQQAALALQRLLPGSQRVALPAAGHLSLLDDPARYVEAINRFTGALPSG